MGITHSFTSGKSDGGDATLVKPSDWNATHIGSPYPLDSYAIDGTYGDDFTGASLSGSWTRRNFTGGAETYQVGYNQSYLRIDLASRANGDGYFRTAPGGNWTFAAKLTLRDVETTFGIAVVDTNGTGVGFMASYNPHTPWASLLVNITTYSTYGGTYYEPYKSGSTASPNVSIWGSDHMINRPVWLYLRKSSTSYYAAYSLDGEVWSYEAGPMTWAGTVDRVGMMLLAPGTATLTLAAVDVDWFNKIA